MAHRDSRRAETTNRYRASASPHRTRESHPRSVTHLVGSPAPAGGDGPTAQAGPGTPPFGRDGGATRPQHGDRVMVARRDEESGAGDFAREVVQRMDRPGADIDPGRNVQSNHADAPGPKLRIRATVPILCRTRISEADAPVISPVWSLPTPFIRRPQAVPSPLEVGTGRFCLHQTASRGKRAGASGKGIGCQRPEMACDQWCVQPSIRPGAGAG